MYAHTSIRDMFRKLKKSNEGYLLAFGVGDVYEFRYSDAKAIVAALPDIRFDGEVDFKRVTVHKLGFFPFAARLAAKGLKIAMVERRVADNRVTYRIASRSDGK